MPAIQETKGMTTVISDYFRLRTQVIHDEITDIYFYAGKLISRSNKHKDFKDLSNRSRCKIFKAFDDLHDVNFRNFEQGIHSHGTSESIYYCFRSKAMVELFIIELENIRPEFKNVDLNMFETIFKSEIQKFRKYAKLVLEKNYIMTLKE